MRIPFVLFSISVVAAYKQSQDVTSNDGYTTITPSGSYSPVTVTAQYQAIPSYDSSASTYSQYLWVSTVITDADGEACTITKTEEPVTIRHTRATVTHVTTNTNWIYAVPTGAYHDGTATATYETSQWEELYEMIGEIEYKHLGPYAIHDYPGSGLCGHKCNGDHGFKYQPAHVKEFKHGKWTYYNTTYTYGLPMPKATTYETPGTYTVSAYDVTVDETITAPSEATYTAPASTMVTYGGVTTSVDEPCVITARYGAYSNDGAMIKTIIKTTTIYANTPGHYTIVKPTTTRYDHSTECTYPTTTIYEPGVYHHSKETITITKPHQAYTCSYYQTPTATSRKSVTTDRHSIYVTSPEDGTAQSYNTPSSKHDDSYPTPFSSRPSYKPTSMPPSSANDRYSTASPTNPRGPDPSSDYEEPEESYGTAYAGYVKRGGMLERRKAHIVKVTPPGKRVILV
ncbi:hypothetical protein N0V90_010756 [Kalmusia sp. IMI 367209]|nr:hypothetical protein N0V90_010756 [Kalmusia sp. IMI 367209]